MDKNTILTWAATILVAILGFVIVEIVNQDLNLLDIIGFALVFGILFPIVSTLLAKRIAKTKA